MSTARQPVRRAQPSGRGAVVLRPSDLTLWAGQVAPQRWVLREPLSWEETPLRRLSSRRLSYYAGRYLAALRAGAMARRGVVYGPWDEAWFRERAGEAQLALFNLYLAVLERFARPIPPPGALWHPGEEADS